MVLSQKEPEMKLALILILALLGALRPSSSFADICVCQISTNIKTHFGDGMRSQVPFYTLGCMLWLAQQKNCRIERITNINNPLTELLDRKHRPKEKIILGYVAHWSNSDTHQYLDQVILPLMERYQSSVEFENTACHSSAASLFDVIKSYTLPEGTYLRINGNQGVSVGMWDKVIGRMRRADIPAIADTRNDRVEYPRCSKYIHQPCIGAQLTNTAKCTQESGRIAQLKCQFVRGKTPYHRINAQGKFIKRKQWLLVGN